MIKVAIVERNKTVRESLETFLSLAPGCQCVGAWPGPEEALQELHQQPPDVVLLDVQSPRARGAECTAHVKERLPHAQIILLTVYEDPERIFGALQAGASGYLLKRSTREQIIAAIRRAHRTASASRLALATAAQNSPNGELGRSGKPVTLAGEPG